MASRLGQMMVRRFSTSQPRRAGDSPEAVALWRNLTLFGALPAVGLVGLYVYLEEAEHAKHHVRPEFKKMEYMYVRTRRFPWGDGNHSFFHNSKVNALPEGYEDEE